MSDLHDARWREAVEAAKAPRGCLYLHAPEWPAKDLAVLLTDIVYGRSEGAIPVTDGADGRWQIGEPNNLRLSPVPDVEGWFLLNARYGWAAAKIAALRDFLAAWQRIESSFVAPEAP